MPTPSCPLCASGGTNPYVRVHGRPHFACAVCGLIFVPPAFHPDADAERRRYDTHNNDPADAGYRAYLARVAAPLMERVPPPAEGLDFGSGPGPTLSLMLTERGYDVAIYDPYFAPDPNVLKRTYAFITCTETAEHFHAPAREFDRLDDMLRPGGWLALMTQWADGKDFARWSYARDPTHVCFYQARTMSWIAARYEYALESPRRDVALFQKSPTASADDVRLQNVEAPLSPG